MVENITKHKQKIHQLFKDCEIERAFIFGSAVTGNFNENSDVDFLVKFKNNIDPLKKGEFWWILHDNLRDLLKREIDIVTEKSLKNPYFIEELNKTKQKIYG